MNPLTSLLFVFAKDHLAAEESQQCQQRSIHSAVQHGKQETPELRNRGMAICHQSGKPSVTGLAKSTLESLSFNQF